MLLHRLVALTFLPNTDNKLTVNHKNHDPSNNHIDNLEWATHQEQNNHKKKPLNQELISSRKVLLKNIMTAEETIFDTMVDACKYIYDNNLKLFEKYDSFEKAKKTLKSKVCQAIRYNIKK